MRECERPARFAAGNPLNKRAQQIRIASLDAVTPEEMGEAARKLLKQAKDGDLRAFTELADRTIGRPTTQDVVERLERLESALDGVAHGRPIPAALTSDPGGDEE